MNILAGGGLSVVAGVMRGAFPLPNLIGEYASVSGAAIAAMTFFGAGWGIGAIYFGIGVGKVGLALIPSSFCAHRYQYRVLQPCE